MHGDVLGMINNLAEGDGVAAARPYRGDVTLCSLNSAVSAEELEGGIGGTPVNISHTKM